MKAGPDILEKKRRNIHRACKLFATDLDGTVLYEKDGSAVATRRTARALRRLQKQGTQVVLASGRMHESMVLIARHLGLNCPLLSYNGAMLRMPHEKNWKPPLFHLPLEAGMASEIIDLAEARGLALNFYWRGRLYLQRTSLWKDLYRGRTSSPTVEVGSLKSMKGKRPTKLLMMGQPAKIRRLKAELAPRFAGRANVVITSPEYLEFMELTANKGRALSLLAQRLGVEREEVVAAGDGANDIEMLRWAGTGVAVSTAGRHVRRWARHVVKPPALDGLAEFIEKNLLKEQA
jgi:Cof subfamily protein (haloacid dehalogenase superfamily)